jgi:hypothetical protein
VTFSHHQSHHTIHQVCHSMENTAIYSVFASSPVSCMPRVMSHRLHSYYGSTCQRMTPVVPHGLMQATQEHYWQSYALLSQAGAPLPYQWLSHPSCWLEWLAHWSSLDHQNQLLSRDIFVQLSVSAFLEEAWT